MIYYNWNDNGSTIDNRIIDYHNYNSNYQLSIIVEPLSIDNWWFHKMINDNGSALIDNENWNSDATILNQ